jgi:co-chaperonin GroES (HSP10)
MEVAYKPFFNLVLLERKTRKPKSGIILTVDTQKNMASNWGKIVAVGPNVADDVREAFENNREVNFSRFAGDWTQIDDMKKSDETEISEYFLVLDNDIHGAKMEVSNG